MKLEQKFQEDRGRRMNAITAVSIVLATLLMGFRDQILLLLFNVPRHYVEEGRLDDVGRLIFATGLMFAFVAASVLLLRYLRGDLSLVRRSANELQASGEFVVRDEYADRLSQAEARLQTLQDAIATKVDPVARESVQALHDSLAERLTQTLPDALRQKITDDIARVHSVEHTRELLQQARARLSNELAALGRRGNLNLVIGSLTTAVAVALLYQAATTPPPSGTDYVGLLTFYVPRVTLAAFVELFSFFFLKLYRGGLTDLKYFHAEILALELRIAALETASRQGDPQFLAKVVASIADIDRTKQLIDDKKDDGLTSIDPKVVAGIVEAAMKLGKSDAKG